MIRGEIWWADLPDPFGSEPGYRRPVLVLQSNEFNRSRLNTIVVIALTSNPRQADMPGNVLLPARKTGLSKDSVANVTQLAALDRQFLKERCGKVTGDYLIRVEEGVRLVLDL